MCNEIITMSPSCMVSHPTTGLTSSIFLFHVDLFNDAVVHVVIPSVCFASKPAAYLHLELYILFLNFNNSDIN